MAWATDCAGASRCFLIGAELLVEQVFRICAFVDAAPRSVGAPAYERPANSLFDPDDQAWVLPDPCRQPGTVIKVGVELTGIGNLV
jgi:hypothetical protein